MVGASINLIGSFSGVAVAGIEHSLSVGVPPYVSGVGPTPEL